MTRYPDLFAALAAPFEPHEVKVRAQSGRQFHYITARTAMNRLDAVLGPENWWDEFQADETSVLCRLTIRLPDDTTLTKADAGGYAGMADSGDDDKSGYSDAFKRAAVKFGVARYLYRDGVPEFVRERVAPQVASAPASDYNGAPVADPAPAPSPAPAPAPAPAAPAPAPSSNGNGNGRGSGSGSGSGSVPRSGKALFAWTKKQEQIHEVGLLKYLNGWAKLQEFPGRMVDWNPEQVAAGHREAVRKLGQRASAADPAPAPARDPEADAAAARRSERATQPGPRDPNAPRTGKALYAWIRQSEDEGATGLLKAVNAWGKTYGCPYKMTEWDAPQAHCGYAAAQRYLATGNADVPVADAASPPEPAGPGAEADADEDIPF